MPGPSADVQRLRYIPPVGAALTLVFFSPWPSVDFTPLHTSRRDSCVRDFAKLPLCPSAAACNVPPSRRVTARSVTGEEAPPLNGVQELHYTADLLRPDAGIVKRRKISRRKLTSRDGFGLKPRDVVTLLARSPTLGFDLNVRPGAVVISLGADGPSVIAGPDEAWIFHRGRASAPVAPMQRPNSGARRQGDEVQNFKQVREEDEKSRNEELVPLVARERALLTLARIRERFLEVEGSPDAEDSLEISPRPLLETSGLPVPFPLAVTEAALSVFTEKLEASMRQVTLKVKNLVGRIEGDLLTEVDIFEIEQIRVLKMRLGRIETVSGSLQKTLFERIGDEDDMELLAQKVSGCDVCSVEDWELCFEYYLQKGEEVQSDAQRQVQDLDNLESFINLLLSRRRLELEQINLGLETLAAGFGFGAFLTGAFGMNLVNPFETSRAGFAKITVGISLLSAALFVGLRWAIKRRMRRRRPVLGAKHQIPS